MASKLISWVLVSAVVLLCVTSHAKASSLQNFLRKNIPEGYDMDSFVEVCEECGVLYGNDFTYKCLSDRSKRMFDGCLIAVTSKRKR